jgi:hypothetical protein
VRKKVDKVELPGKNGRSGNWTKRMVLTKMKICTYLQRKKNNLKIFKETAQVLIELLKENKT